MVMAQPLPQGFAVLGGTLGHSATLNQADKHGHDCSHEKDMDQSSHGEARDQAQSVEYKQHDCDGH